MLFRDSIFTILLRFSWKKQQNKNKRKNKPSHLFLLVFCLLLTIHFKDKVLLFSGHWNLAGFLLWLLWFRFFSVLFQAGVWFCAFPFLLIHPGHGCFNCHPPPYSPQNYFHHLSFFSPSPAYRPWIQGALLALFDCIIQAIDKHLLSICSVPGICQVLRWTWHCPHISYLEKVECSHTSI